MKFYQISALKQYIVKEICTINNRLAKMNAPKVFISNNPKVRAKAENKMIHYVYRWDLNSHVAKRYQGYHKKYGHLLSVRSKYAHNLKLTKTDPTLMVEFRKDVFCMFNSRIWVDQDEVKYDYNWKYGLAHVWNANQIQNYCKKHLQNNKDYKKILDRAKCDPNLQTLDIDLKYLHMITLKNGDQHYSSAGSSRFYAYEKHLEQINPKLAHQQESEITVSNAELDQLKLELADKAGTFHEWSMRQVAKYSQKRLQATRNMRVWKIYYDLYQYAKNQIEQHFDTFSYDYPIKHAGKLLDPDDIQGDMDGFCVSSYAIQDPINNYAKKHGLNNIKTLDQVEKALA